MPNYLSLKYKSDTKSISGFDAFKKGFSTGDIDTKFKNYYNAAIDYILKHKTSEAFNYTSQDNLVEYCVFVKLYDAEDQTVILFNKFSEFIEMEPSDTGYTILKDTKLEKFTDAPTKNLDGIARRNSLTTEIITNSLINKPELIKNPRFQRLLLLLLIIRYYPLTVLSFIFENGKNIITSLKANTSAINTDATKKIQIQHIVNQINKPNTDNLSDDDLITAVNANRQFIAAAEDHLVQLQTQVDKKLTSIRSNLVELDKKRKDTQDALKTAAGTELEAARIANDEAQQKFRTYLANAKDEANKKGHRPTIDAIAQIEEGLAASAASGSGSDDSSVGNSMHNPEPLQPLPQQPSMLEKAFGSIFSRQTGGQVGGTNEVATILQTITNAADKNNTEVSNLVKYSTNIFYKALTLLSLSIGFPINTNDTLIKDLVYNINNYLTTELSADNLKPLIDAIADLIQKPDNYISGTIIKIDSIMAESINPAIQAVAVEAPAAAAAAPGKKVKRPLSGRIAIKAAIAIVKDMILKDLSGVAQRAALPVGEAIISKYANKGIDEEYTREIGEAIVNIYKKYSQLLLSGKSSDTNSIKTAAEMAAKNVRENIDYDIGVEFYMTRGKELQMGGGRLDPDFNFENNLRKIIQKGIEHSKFFISVGDSSSLIIKGGQRTQRNRNRTRSRSSGGTRKNMNSIEMDDYDDLII